MDILQGTVLLDIVFNWGLGWRYLLSSQFRARVHQRWSTRSRASVIGDIIVRIVFFVLINATILVFVAYTLLWLYCGIVVPRLSP